ncbi:serine/arginine repetitive matrix protein 1-like [Ostrinia furnacalis]|uniref:serine/arginine repetitive matrix protein 1-like n=1 Tax=Ostrinia furnacalis TaxID=93504 RepID=UPI00103EB218|nr:serine/arginine repetitive matrix protein 1-like [Ostrinia furnacalis]
MRGVASRHRAPSPPPAQHARSAPSLSSTSGNSPPRAAPKPAETEGPTVSSRLEIRVRPPDSASPGHEVKIHSVVSGEPTRPDDASVYYDATEHQRDKRSSTRSGDKSQSPAVEKTRLDAIPDSNSPPANKKETTSGSGDGSQSMKDRWWCGTASRIPVAMGEARLAKCLSWSGDGPLAPPAAPPPPPLDNKDLTPGLRRRRANPNDKYAVDPARELNLRFARLRHRCPQHSRSPPTRSESRGVPSLLMSSPPASGSSSSGSPPPAPRAPAAPHHNAARARRFRPLSIAP